MRVKQMLFLLFMLDLFLVLWGIFVAVMTFFIDADILVFPYENIRLLLVLSILFAISSLVGLTLAVLYNKKYYMKLFPLLQGAVFVLLLFTKAFFG